MLFTELLTESVEMPHLTESIEMPPQIECVEMPPLTESDETPCERTSTTNVCETPPGRTATVKQPLRYLGDIKTKDLDSPNRRKECLKLIRFQGRRLQMERNRLKKSNKRLREQVKSLKDLVCHLRKKNLVSENTSLCMQVSTGK